MFLRLNRRHFEYLRKSGKKILGNDVLFIVSKKETDDKKTRLGFSLSRKIGPSVVRSRIKRCFRVAVRQTIAKENLWIHIIPKKGRRWLYPSEIDLQWSMQECQILKGRLENPSS